MGNAAAARVEFGAAVIFESGVIVVVALGVDDTGGAVILAIFVVDVFVSLVQSIFHYFVINSVLSRFETSANSCWKRGVI